MLLERKKYNYIATKGSASRGSLGVGEGQNGRIEQLEKANHRIVQETTKQFKKLQSDVQRVECILQEKEAIIGEWKASHARLSEQKNILIEALYEKDIIIHQFEAKLQQYLQQIHNPCTIANSSTQEQENKVEMHRQTAIETGTQTQIEGDLENKRNDAQSQLQEVQTEDLQAWKQTQFDAPCNLVTLGCFDIIGKKEGESQTAEDEKYKELFERAMTLEDEVYRLREELYDTNSQLALTQHQFQTHKILTEMQRIK